MKKMKEYNRIFFVEENDKRFNTAPLLFHQGNLERGMKFTPVLEI